MAQVKSLYKQVKINFSYIAKHALTCTCSVIASIEIIGFLCDFNMVFPENLTYIKRLLISAAFVLVFCGKHMGTYREASGRLRCGQWASCVC